MDYTTAARFRAEIHSKGIEDGNLISLMVSAASRAIDRYCTGVVDAKDYFLLESVSNEQLEGQVDYRGKTILCYPHKPIVTAVSSFVYQEDVTATAYSVAVARVRVRGPAVTAFPTSLPLSEYPLKVDVTISYTGGLAAKTEDLPDDLQEAATVLAIRYYREAETGLTDAIGVAELSTMVYTKAWPVRVKESLLYYKRLYGWRRVA